MRFWRQYPWLARGLVLGVAALFAMLPAIWAPLLVQTVEERVGDWFWVAASDTSRERRVVLVDIDERSLREVGSWPWARSTMAELVSQLDRAGAGVQVLDMTFSEPRDDDAVLARAFAATKPVVAQLFSLDAGATPAIGELSGALPDFNGCPASVPVAQGHYGLAPELLAAGAFVGHITPTIDPDGVIRKLPALVCRHGKLYPSLALTALSRAAGSLQPVATGPALAPDARTTQLASGLAPWRWVGREDLARYGGWLAPSSALVLPALPDIVVPLDAQGTLRIPYRLSRSAFVSVPAADVLRGRVNPEWLRGSIVIVGSTAFGMGDTIATPLNPVAAGFEVHAQTLIGLFDQALPHTPHHWPYFQALLMALCAGVLLAAAKVSRGVPAKRLPLVGLALVSVVLIGAGVALSAAQLWLPWFVVVTFCLLAALSLATLEHGFARAQRERLSAHLGAYLPGPVAERLMASEPTGNIQFEPREISVLVAQVRNFTALAVGGRPDEIAALLHAYCCVSVAVIEKHGGVVENLVGDKITAVWNAQSDCVDHPRRACAAACEMVAATSALFASTRPVLESGPLQPLALGVGVESGSALVGSFGPSRRRAHAALGQPVSVAERLELMTADLAVPVLVGPQLAAEITGEGLEPLGEYLLEGLGQHARLFTVQGWAELVLTDPEWARSARSATDRTPEQDTWSGWANARSNAADQTARPPPFATVRRTGA